MKSLNEIIKENFGNSVNVISRIAVSGGDINSAYALNLSDGGIVFMKANSKSNSDFFRAEAEGLEAIRRTETINCPKVIARGTEGDESFLLLEHIEKGYGGKEASEELGIRFAQMHTADADRFVRNGSYGFISDNYIGSGLQKNTPRDSWREFFIECRLLPQFERAYSYFTSSDRKIIDKFLGKTEQYITEPSKPSLLHGDLWAGNYMIDSSGHPWLIDPAAYVGHAEADIAMTELFGGFDSTFYAAYAGTAGLDSGYKDRKDIYNLYHLLNHLNLFGSGYLSSVKSILNRYAG